MVKHAHSEQPKNITEKSSYVLGVFPALPISQLDKLFSPIGQEIGQGLNRAILFQSSSSYPKYSERLDNKDFDIAFVHPFDYVLHAEKAGYIPLVRKGEDLTAIFVVPIDSPIRTIKDLRGKIIAMPPEGSAVSSLAKAEFISSGFEPTKDIFQKHFGEHDSSLQNVVIKNADAAVTCRAILRIYENSLGTKLRIIAETAPIPHSLFVVHKRVPKKERDIIRNVLLSTTLAGVPSDLRKAFVVEGKKIFVNISETDINKMKASIGNK